MKHDYDLPAPGEWAMMSDEERDRWFKQERARRQARSQDTATARRIAKGRERQDRRADAAPGTVHLGSHR